MGAEGETNGNAPPQTSTPHFSALEKALLSELQAAAGVASPQPVEHTLRQAQALSYLTNAEDCALMYGGGKGGGKSWLLCMWAGFWAQELIVEHLKLPKSANPPTIGFLGRKIGLHFERTTLETWRKIMPPALYEIRASEREIVILSSAKIMYGGLDDRERIQKFNSAELAFIALDQAEETERHDVDVLQAALRFTYKGKKPAYKQLYTANPGEGWLKEDFIDHPQPHHYFVPALYKDNPYLPANYAETLERAFRYNEALLRAYRDGDWSAVSDGMTLITHQMLEKLRHTTVHPTSTHRIISCDPSLGGDECVIYVVENGAVVEEASLQERDTMKIAGTMLGIAARFSCPSFVVDSIGIGAGIADRLREIRPEASVYALNVAEASSQPERFANKRAEMYWQAMEQIHDCLIPYPQDEELRRQLTAIRFKPVDSSGKVQLELKDKTRQRLGRSPDRADCFAMALWALPQTEPVTATDRWANAHRSGEVVTATKTWLGA